VYILLLVNISWREAMNRITYKRNELLASTVLRGLESRDMKGYYAKDKKEALDIALSIIPEGATISKGGSASVSEIRLLNAVKTGKYNYINREDYESRRDAAKAGHFSDIFLASTNSITEDGILVNIDGTSDRVSAIAFGPQKVILIVGMNKVCKDVDSALKRARNTAAPINANRFDISTPCKKTGSCINCKSPDTICCQFLITRFSREKDRIIVILVNDELGF